VDPYLQYLLFEFDEMTHLDSSLSRCDNLELDLEQNSDLDYYFYKTRNPHSVIFNVLFIRYENVLWLSGKEQMSENRKRKLEGNYTILLTVTVVIIICSCRPICCQ